MLDILLAAAFAGAVVGTFLVCLLAPIFAVFWLADELPAWIKDRKDD